MVLSRTHALLASLMLGWFTIGAAAQRVPLDEDTVKAVVLAETNAHRTRHNLPQLQPNPALEAAAAAYAAYLAEHEAMGHSADGSTPAKRVRAAGYTWCYIAENVWSSFRKPETMFSEDLARRAMEGWKNSPGHNANLLSGRARDIGVGAAEWKHEGKTIFRVVEVFAAPCPNERRPTPAGGDKLADKAHRDGRVWRSSAR